MSWDIVLLNSRQKINSGEEIDENQLEPTDFDTILENHFSQITVCDDDHRSIEGNDFSIEYSVDGERVSNKLLHLYGENGLYELAILAGKYNWQIFDTGLGQMLDLENPANNGFEQFQNYLRQIKEG